MAQDISSAIKGRSCAIQRKTFAGVNSGIFLLRNSDWSRSFVEAMVPFGSFPNNYTYDEVFPTFSHEHRSVEWFIFVGIGLGLDEGLLYYSLIVAACVLCSYILVTTIDPCYQFDKLQIPLPTVLDHSKFLYSKMPNEQWLLIPMGLHSIADTWVRSNGWLQLLRDNLENYDMGMYEQNAIAYLAKKQPSLISHIFFEDKFCLNCW